MTFRKQYHQNTDDIALMESGRSYVEIGLQKHLLMTLPTWTCTFSDGAYDLMSGKNSEHLFSSDKRHGRLWQI